MQAPTANPFVLTTGGFQQHRDLGPRHADAKTVFRYVHTHYVHMFDKIREEAVCVGVEKDDRGVSRAFFNFDLDASQTFLHWKVAPGAGGSRSWHAQTRDGVAGPLHQWTVDPSLLHFHSPHDERTGKAQRDAALHAIEADPAFHTALAADAPRVRRPRTMGAPATFHEFARTQTHPESPHLLQNCRDRLTQRLCIVWLNKQLLKEMISYASHKYSDSVHNRTQSGLQEVRW